MSNYCTMCGRSIPEGQSTCSSCYGDPFHGSDGYLLEEMEQSARQQEYEQQQAEQEQSND